MGDATALDFAPGRFTGAASFHMLHHIEPAEAQDRVFAELARVLVPGSCPRGGRRDLQRRQRRSSTRTTPTTRSIPEELEPRLAAAGFGSVRVRTYDLGWVCTARVA